VRNRHRGICICVAFALASTLSMLAQSDRVDSQRWNGLQPKGGDASQALLTASLLDAPLIGGVSSESELPDAPSSAKPDTSTAAEPAPTPAIKRESHGAPPAAAGGPLGADRSVADRNYLILTGAMFSASIVNAELTMRCLNEGTCTYVPSSLRSRTALYGIGIPADLGISYLSYYMKKKHSRIWYVPSAFVTAANVYVAVHAYHRTQQ
jgi:hypothetical protein